MSGAESIAKMMAHQIEHPNEVAHEYLDLTWREPQPLPDGMPSVMPFDRDLLPDVLWNYVNDVSRRLPCSPDYVAVGVLCACAAVIGCKVVMQPKAKGDWHVVPNLWGGIIGRPSTKKSPAAREAFKPIKQLETSYTQEYTENLKHHETGKKLAQLMSAEVEKQAAKLIKENKVDEAERVLSAERDNAPTLESEKRIQANDSSIEALGVLMNENPAGILLYRDELSGLLSKLNQEQYQAERAVYLESFNGCGSYTYDRIGRGKVHIENLCLSIFGGTQPSKIEPIVRGAVSGSSDDGLLQRFQLLVWPDQPKPTGYQDHDPDLDAAKKYDAVIRSLAQIPMDECSPRVFKFDADAQQLYIDWFTEFDNQLHAPDLHSSLESHFAKMHKTIPSLALIFALVDGATDTVNASSLGRALDWADYLISHARRVYSVGLHGEAEAAKQILKRKASLPDPFKAREVYRKGWAGLSDKAVVQGAINILIDHHYLRQSAVDYPEGGRSTIAYTWQGGKHGALA